MKKKLLAVMAGLSLVVALGACGEPFTCDLCGEEKTGKAWKVTMFGESDELTICDDCYQEVQALKEALN